MRYKYGLKNIECRNAIDWVIEKFQDYADDEEDEVVIRLNFRKGYEEQEKWRCFTTATNKNDRVGEWAGKSGFATKKTISKLNTLFAQDVCCEECGCSLESNDYGIDTVIFDFCPRCGKRNDLDIKGE